MQKLIYLAMFVLCCIVALLICLGYYFSALFIVSCVISYFFMKDRVQ